MHTTKDERALAPSVIVEIAPVYKKAMAATTEHYRVMVEFMKGQMVFLSQKSAVKSQKFFTADLEEMAGGVR